MKILFIGDIYGRAGRNGLRRAFPVLKQKYEPDMIIINGENSAGGKGITERIARQFFNLGVDVITGGNHSLHQKGSEDVHDDEPRLLRPSNFPPGTPGHGSTLYNSSAGFPVGVINICGRAFMAHFDDPFRAVNRLIRELEDETSIIIVDFHAETTSEKVAMGWYLNGRVSAVLGTHTHIQTADETILDDGTAFITDVGMTGSYDSVIGADKNNVLESMLTLRPKRFNEAQPRDVRVCGVCLSIDPISGKALEIARVCEKLGDLLEEQNEE